MHRPGIKNQAADSLSWLMSLGRCYRYHQMEWWPTRQPSIINRTPRTTYQRWSGWKLQLMPLSTVLWYCWNRNQGPTRGSGHCPQYLDAHGNWRNSNSGTFLQAQDLYLECHAAAQRDGFTTSLFTYECDGVSVRQAPVNGALRKYRLGALQARILYFFHDLTLPEYLREQCMYATMRHHFFSLHMRNRYIWQLMTASHARKMDLK